MVIVLVYFLYWWEESVNEVNIVWVLFMYCYFVLLIYVVVIKEYKIRENKCVVLSF